MIRPPELQDDDRQDGAPLAVIDIVVNGAKESFVGPAALSDVFRAINEDRAGQAEQRDQEWWSGWMLACAGFGAYYDGSRWMALTIAIIAALSHRPIRVRVARFLRRCL